MSVRGAQQERTRQNQDLATVEHAPRIAGASLQIIAPLPPIWYVDLGSWRRGHWTATLTISLPATII